MVFVLFPDLQVFPAPMHTTFSMHTTQTILLTFWIIHSLPKWHLSQPQTFTTQPKSTSCMQTFAGISRSSIKSGLYAVSPQDSSTSTPLYSTLPPTYNGMSFLCPGDHPFFSSWVIIVLDLDLDWEASPMPRYSFCDTFIPCALELHEMNPFLRELKKCSPFQKETQYRFCICPFKESDDCGIGNCKTFAVSFSVFLLSLWRVSSDKW